MNIFMEKMTSQLYMMDITQVSGKVLSIRIHLYNYELDANNNIMFVFEELFMHGIILISAFGMNLDFLVRLIPFILTYYQACNKTKTV